MSNTRERNVKHHDRNDRFRRAEKTIDLRPVFYIASEGKNTEPDYFKGVFASLYSNVHIVMLEEEKEKGAIRGHDPKKLKERVRKKLGEIVGKGIMRCEAINI